MPGEPRHYLLGLSVRGHRTMPDPRISPAALAAELRHRLKPGNYKRFLSPLQQTTAAGVVQSVANKQGGRGIVVAPTSTGVYALLALPGPSRVTASIRRLAYSRLRDKAGWPKGAAVFTARPLVAELDPSQVAGVARLLQGMLG